VLPRPEQSDWVKKKISSCESYEQLQLIQIAERGPDFWSNTQFSRRVHSGSQTGEDCRSRQSARLTLAEEKVEAFNAITLDMHPTDQWSHDTIIIDIVPQGKRHVEWPGSSQ